jgi:chromosome segregation ATPase
VAEFSPEVKRALDDYYELRAKMQPLEDKVSELQDELKPLRKRAKQLEGLISAEFEELEAEIAETDSVIARVIRRGYDRKSKSYKKAFEVLLGKVNAQLRKIAEEVLETSAKVSHVPAKFDVEPKESRVGDAVRKAVRAVTKLLSGLFHTLAGANDEIRDALDQFERSAPEGE